MAGRIVCCTVLGLCCTASSISAQGPAPQPAPRQKTLLIVTTTLGFRHAAVPLQEKLIRDYAASTGAFKVISTSDSPDFPTAEYQATIDQRNSRIKIEDAKDNDKAPFLNTYGGLPGGTAAQQVAVTAMIAAVAPAVAKEAAARSALSNAIVAGGSDLTAKLHAEATASRELAEARIGALAKIQAGPDKLNAAQLRVVQQAGTREEFSADAPLSPAQQARIDAIAAELMTAGAADGTARAALVSASFGDGSADLVALSSALEQADAQYAQAAAKSFAQLQASAERLTPAEQASAARSLGVRTTAPRRAGGGRPQGADPLAERVKKVLATYLSAEALKQYDAVAFLSTTGELPLPDNDALIDWVRAGHGFVGVHSATDTLHKDAAYIDMIGGEFATHGVFQPKASVYNVDPKSPLTAGWGASVAMNEEFYLFKSYDPKKVHVLLELKQQPYSGENTVVPVSWIRMYGKGRVFYTSLGHRDDVLFDAPIGDQEFKKRYNGPAVSKAVDEHILSGVRYALGLVDADATPQAR